MCAVFSSEDETKSPKKKISKPGVAWEEPWNGRHPKRAPPKEEQFWMPFNPDRFVAT